MTNLNISIDCGHIQNKLSNGLVLINCGGIGRQQELWGVGITDDKDVHSGHSTCSRSGCIKGYDTGLKYKNNMCN